MSSITLNAVIGKPIGHSLSPRLHQAIYEAYQISAVLLPFEIEDLNDYLRAVRTLNIELTAVTLPYKESIVPLLDEVDPLALEIGAVNTVLKKDGRLIGYNTDYLGIYETLKKIDLKGKKALVLGCGGVARPLIHYLCGRGARVVLTNRSFEKLQTFKDRYELEILPWEERNTCEADFVANTTPIGMAPLVDESPLPKIALHSGQVIFDVIYNPSPTLLLKDAAAAGAQTINGLSLFIAQAYEQIFLWRGIRPHLNSPETLLFNS